MTKRQPTPRTVTLELPPEGERPPDEEPPQTAAERAEAYSRETAGMDEDDAQEFFAGLDELRTTRGVVFQVYRTEPTDRAGFCTEYAANIFSLQRVTKDYGAGVYRVRVKADGRYIPGGGTFRIAEGVTVDPSQSHGADSISEMLRSLDEREQRRREASASAMKEWAAILAPLLVPAVTNLFAPKNQVTELVTALGALQGLTPKPKDPPDMMTQLDQLSGMMAKLREMSGDEKQTSGSTWIDLIRDGAQAIRPVLEGAMGALIARSTGAVRPALPGVVPAPASLPSTQPPQPAATPSTPSPSPTPNTETDPMLALIPWLRATMDQMALQALRDRDPEMYAEVVVDNLPDGASPNLVLDFIRREDWWTLLTQLAPNVTPYKGWFTRFRDAAIELLEEQLQAPKPTPPPPKRAAAQPPGAPPQVQEFPEEPGGDA